jgi:protein TBF1
VTQDGSADAAKKKAPHPSQSVPTVVLYERARKAAASKANNGHRKPGVPSARRPWTPHEEGALMTGLDMVKGPHWSQILALFGQGGSHGEQLKDRNQVQLKDKARNLKLFFLKNSDEMPFYLKGVTGDLKTRAPGQASKKEAEARLKANAVEEKDRVNGIMTLAQGLQDHDYSDSAVSTPSPASDGSPFHEVEPASQEHTLPVLQSEDEHLRQSLLAASGVSVRSGAAPTASMI